MTHSLEQLDRDIRLSKKIAVGYKAPQESGPRGIGVTVSLFYQQNSYMVSVEEFRDDGGYGENLSRIEHAYETLQTAIAAITQHGFKIEQLIIQ
jgi:hypothetical protein